MPKKPTITGEILEESKALERLIGARERAALHDVLIEDIDPNPFNPLTSIKYSLPRQSYVRLRIFNLRGQMIRSLVDDAQNGGVHTAVWDGRDDRGLAVSSGTYFARLESAEGTLTRKMLLIK